MALIPSYQPGGSLPPDAQIYVERQADRDLLTALLAGEYCYVLNSRQMGKSSLRVRTMSKLKAKAVRCTEVELSGIGSQQITPSQWYGGIIQELVSGFELQVDCRAWLRDREDLSSVQRLGDLIESILLVQITDPIIIFIDEVDSVLSLSFPTDEFFGLIRNCFERRATRVEYRRLTFALLGVATPSDLIQDKYYSTPFNIGRAIELKGFQIRESFALSQGLVGRVRNPEQVVKEVLRWTGGQPFLTQKLLWLIVQDVEQRCETLQSIGAEFIRSLVKTHILSHWESQDEPEHLRTIQDRILRNSHSSERLLLLYRKILRWGKIPDGKDLELLELKLSGLVEQRQGNLVVKNPIYQTIFNQRWVNQALQRLNPQPALPPLWQTLLLSTVVMVGVVGVRHIGWLQPLELQIFDHLMRLRPTESPDDRLFIITITEADVQSQPAIDRKGSSLSDRTLEQLLTKLEQGQPEAIGLDIYREAAVAPTFPRLAQIMRTNDRFFAICFYGHPGVPSPPEVPEERVGFNTVVVDEDGVLRRHLLAAHTKSVCSTPVSINLQLALRYLEKHQITLSITQEGYLQLGSIIFQPLDPRSGPYQVLDARGHQILLNYRAAQPIAPIASMQEVLSPTFDLERVRGRIVMIGTNASSFNDHVWRTPYSQGSTHLLSGIEIQAQMVSHLLSSTLDQRPLLWWLPLPLEILWIGSWAIVGGLLSRSLLSVTRLGLATGLSLVVLFGACWLVLLRGGILPLLPAILVLVSSSVIGLSYYQIAITSKKSKKTLI